MKKEVLTKVETWINKLRLIDPEASTYLEKKKWAKAVFAVYMRASFGLLTSQSEIIEKRHLALELYRLSKDIGNKRGKGLAFELLTRHLLQEKDHEFAYRCFLQAKRFFIGDMAWIGLKELCQYFPDHVLNDLETPLRSFDDSPDALLLLFIEKYQV